MGFSNGSVIGKYSPAYLERYVFQFLGEDRDDVLVKPASGFDNGVIKLGDGKVLVVTTDPFFFIPSHGLRDAAWHAWHITGSDITTCGFAPTHIVLNFTLPVDMKDEEFAEIMEVCDQEAKKYGASIVTGHTGRYSKANYPFIGSAMFLSICPDDQYVTPSMVSPGDVIMMTKGVPISAIGMLARTFPKKVRNNVGHNVWKEAYDYILRSSCMDDALIAASVGLRNNGVTAMHDASEGGIVNALFELGGSSNVGLRINYDDIIIPYEAELICKEFSLDPLSSVSLGTLIIASRKEKAVGVIRALEEKGIAAQIIGKAVEKEEGLIAFSKGKELNITPPRTDPFWLLLAKGEKEGWL